MALMKQAETIAQQLMTDCPQNDCRLFLVYYNELQELQAAIPTVGEYPAHVLQKAANKLTSQLNEMYLSNYAINAYRKEKRAQQ